MMNKTIIRLSMRAVMALLLAVMTTTTVRAYVLADESLWTIEKFNDGADCYITGYTGTKTGVTELTIPSTIDGANVKKFKDFSLEGFRNLVTLNFDMFAPIEEMPSLRGCHDFKNVNLYHTYDNVTVSYPNALPVNIKVIPAYTFYATALEELQIEYHGEMTIGDYAFSELNNTSCTIIYGGPASDWNYHKYEGSWRLQVRVLSEQATEEPWYCGWFGDGINKDNKIYWTRDKNLHMTITSDNWDTFPTKQVLTSLWLDPDTKVKSLYIEHVYAIEDEAFLFFWDLETVEIASGLTSIGIRAFNACPITSVTLPATLESIGDYAFSVNTNLEDVYFDGTKAQWDAVTKGTDWNFGRSSNYQEHWRCTLTYDMQGHGTAPAPQTVYSNTALTAPEEPTAQGYTFVGWYRYPTAAQPFFIYPRDRIDTNTTLYARWTANTNTITFDLNNQDGHGTAIDAQEVVSGNVVSVPAMQYYTDDNKVYGIEGWYTDQACTDAYDFATVVDHSFTLYAKWAEATGSATVSATAGGTVTLTDALGREVEFGKIFPGQYTLTVTPVSGYSFSGSYTRTKRSDGMGEMAHTFGGTTAYTAQIDLTAHDMAVTVTFSEITTHKVYVTVNVEDGVTPGTFTLADNAGHSYTGDGTETLAKVYDESEQFWNTAYDLTLTITKGESGCAAKVVSNGVTKYIDNSTTTCTFTPMGSVDICLYFFKKGYNPSNYRSSVNLYDNSIRGSTAGRYGTGPYTVRLNDRILWRDGNWNTLCLPFSLKSLTDTPLEGATVMKLNTTSATGSGANKKYNTRFDEENGALNLYFTPVSSIDAGQPYIVKWETTGDPVDPIESPVFDGVFYTATDPVSVTSKDGMVTFVGQFSPFSIVESGASGDDEGNLDEIILLSTGNKLGYSQNPRTLKCFRCHFYVPANGGTTAARSFILNTGDGETDGIRDITIDGESGIANPLQHPGDRRYGVYTLDGRKLDSMPTQKGLYIVNGQKVIIK